MFEPSTKDLYKAVKAPESLKSRVEQLALEADIAQKTAPTAPEKRSFLPSLVQKKLLPAAYTLAACAVAVTIFFVSHRSTPELPVLLVGNENPALSAVSVEPAPGIARYALEPTEPSENSETLSLFLTLETSRPTEITVSQGALSDMLSGEPQETLVFSEDAKIVWDVDIRADQTAVCRITDAKSGKTLSTYILKKENQKWLFGLTEPEMNDTIPTT